MTDNYKNVAAVYRHLMREIDYSEWAEYLYDLIIEYHDEKAEVLEIAAGNGDLAEILAKRFSKFTATDLSYSMLKLFVSNNIDRICCDMKCLPFKKKFDVIISAFDSINYLKSENELIKSFNSVYNILADEGIFTFDVSLECNSLNNIDILNRKESFNGIDYVQNSCYDPVLKMHKNSFTFTMPDGSVITEDHEQKIYSLDTYLELLNKSGFFVMECLDAFSFDDADENTERAQIVVKKELEDADNF